MQVKDVIGEPLSYEELEEERCQEAGPSTAMRKRNGKQSVQRSLCKQPEAAITLPHILEGVTVLPNILVCVEKLRYSGHDIEDKDKFQEFDPQVYMEIKWISVT